MRERDLADQPRVRADRAHRALHAFGEHDPRPERERDERGVRRAAYSGGSATRKTWLKTKA
jgi:hypothetical protein